jgi:hypothetical protein
MLTPLLLLLLLLAAAAVAAADVVVLPSPVCMLLFEKVFLKTGQIATTFFFAQLVKFSKKKWVVALG